MHFDTRYLMSSHVHKIRGNRKRVLCTTSCQWSSRTSVPALVWAHAFKAAEQQILLPEAVQLPRQPPQCQLPRQPPQCQLVD